jgi:membrane protein implicated in regulation of membrane protease activity
MLNLTLLWLIAGSVLCLMELVFPSAFVAFMFGISASIVAAISLILPHFTLLAVLWLVLSTLLILLSRRFFTPKRKLSRLGDSFEAEVLISIPPGKTGRVLYEGNSWQAKCADEDRAIAAGEKVYIVRQEGTTLIILPQKLLD